MLVGGMVGHEVEQDLDIARFCLCHEFVEISHRSELRIDGAVIRNIIPVIVVRRREYGRKPDRVDAQLMQVIEFGGYARQVADAIPIGVIKRTGPDLINDAFPRVHKAHLLRFDVKRDL